jgi:1-acyl-sn-glycerol-3-phosphate acyltransferase
VLVYPGSDLEVFRPWTERNRIILRGRKGFLRLALAAGVPIVPVVSAGTHEQLVVLTRGDRLARWLHMHWTTLKFGPPIRWPSLSPKDAGDPAVLGRCYAEVESAMQSMLYTLAVGRRAFLGQA